MARPARPGASQLSEALYAGLLWLYPGAFRQAYGRDMRRTFGDSSRAAVWQGGTAGLLRLWLLTLPDTLATAAGRHVDEGRRRPLWKLLRLGSLALLATGVFLILTPYGVVGAILIMPLPFLAGLIGLSLTAIPPDNRQRARQAAPLPTAKPQSPISVPQRLLWLSLLGLAVLAAIRFAAGFVAGPDWQSLGGLAGYLSMVLAHGAALLVVLWLNRRPSILGALLAIGLGAVWLQYGSDALENHQLTIANLHLLLNGALAIAALLTLVTAVWSLIRSLRRRVSALRQSVWEV